MWGRRGVTGLCSRHGRGVLTLVLPHTACLEAWTPTAVGRRVRRIASAPAAPVSSPSNRTPLVTCPAGGPACWHWQEVTVGSSHQQGPCRQDQSHHWHGQDAWRPQPRPEPTRPASGMAPGWALATVHFPQLVWLPSTLGPEGLGGQAALSGRALTDWGHQEKCACNHLSVSGGLHRSRHGWSSLQ